MNSPIDEIKERLDIVDVVSSYIKLSKTGANYRALCPFHSEKKPSFFVSPARQIFKCFGCSKAGNIFQFVMDIEGVEFGDALRILAKRAGVELRRQDPKIQTARKRFYDLCELATKFFEKQLHQGPVGRKAKEYLLKRGLSEESIKKWRLGFAPETWDSLMNFLKTKGFSVGEIERAGLVLTGERGKTYDRFRGRIIFPIFDLNSQVIGFGGRVFVKPKGKEEETIAKYLNIPNTLLYNKSKVLYGLNRAKVPIRKEDNCVLVEGYTDVIISHQVGVENVVATSGIALTPHQLSILKRYSKNLITAFDMDIAGDSATKRGIDLAQAQGFDIKVAVLPKDMDPADVASKKAEDWKEIIGQAKSILDFYFENAFSMFNSKLADGKREISRMLLPVIKRVQNKIEQSSWVKELAKRLEVSEESVGEELKKYSLAGVEGAKEEVFRPVPQKTRRELIEEKIVSLILNYPQGPPAPRARPPAARPPEGQGGAGPPEQRAGPPATRPGRVAMQAGPPATLRVAMRAGLDLIKDDFLDYFSPQIREILLQFKEKPKNLPKDLAKFNFSKKVQEFLNFLALQGEVEIEVSEGEIDLDKEILVCLKELKQLTIKERMASLSEKIKQSEREGQKKETEQLSKEFHQLAEQLSQNNNQ